MRISQTLFVLIQGAALVQSADGDEEVPPNWTLHKSCYEKEEIKQDMMLAVKDAADQAALAAQKLKEAIYLPPIPGGPEPPEAAKRIRAVAEFLIPSFLTNVQTVIARYEKIAKLGEPVGKDEGFADGQTWKGLAVGAKKDENYRNFLIACAPDITETTDMFLNTYYQDNLRKDQLHPDSSVITMYNDIKAGQFSNPNAFPLAVTRRSEVAPAGDRLRVPEVIYFHKLWLERLLTKEGSLLAQAKDLEYVTRQDAPQKHRLKNRVAMDTLLWRVEGTLLHELFHLTAFGRLHDIPPKDPRAYGWTNNFNAKNIDNAELLAFLGLAVKLTESNYKVDPEGMITKF